MKILHLADLHLGKRVNEFSMLEDQRYILNQILDIVEEEAVEVVMICGDVYDKGIPPVDAIELLDDFLWKLAEKDCRTLMISGNHDSGDRLGFGKHLFQNSNLFIASQFSGEIEKITIPCENLPVNFYMLPFVKPGMVRQLIQREKEEQGEEIQGEFGYQEAVEALLKREKIDLSERNVLLSHQFYTAGENRPETCDSELAVAAAGGLDEIPIKAVEMFDYVALGHLHGFQSVGRDYICYSGSPYKYSVSEERHKKGILSVKLGKKGQPVEKKRIPLSGLQDVRKEQGTLEEVLGRATEENRKDFVSITLTDEKETYNFRDKLEEVYEYILDIRIDNERIRKAIEGDREELRTLTPLESFCEFYQAVRHMPISQEEAEVMEQVITGVERMGEDG